MLIYLDIEFYPEKKQSQIKSYLIFFTTIGILFYLPNIKYYIHYNLKNDIKTIINLIQNDKS